MMNDGSYRVTIEGPGFQVSREARQSDYDPEDNQPKENLVEDALIGALEMASASCRCGELDEILAYVVLTIFDDMDFTLNPRTELFRAQRDFGAAAQRLYHAWRQVRDGIQSPLTELPDIKAPEPADTPPETLCGPPGTK